MSYITPIYKKGNRKDPGNYRGISVMSSISRVFSSIITNRLEHIIEGKISEDQAGFTKGKSCMDHIFSLRQITEKSYAKGQEIHLIFVDLEKAYDSVPIIKLWDAMEDIGIDLPIISLIRRMYQQCQASIKVGKRLSIPFRTNKGLRQGCSMSPTLFKIYIQQILEQWNQSCGGMGIPVQGGTIHSLIFADDQVIMAQSREDVKYMMRKLLDSFEAGGLQVNMKKTEYLVVGGNGRDISLHQGTIRAVQKFKYLGSYIDDSGSCNSEIDSRLVQARKAIRMLNGVLWSRTILNDTKKRILTAVVESIMTYGAEGWTLVESKKSKILAVEMDGIRRSARVSRLERRRNEEVRRMMDMEETVMDRIERRTLQWYGHVRRMEESRWPKTLLEWSPHGRRKRGRPRTTWRGQIHRLMSDRSLEGDEWLDREDWRMGIQGNR